MTDVTPYSSKNRMNREKTQREEKMMREGSMKRDNGMGKKKKHWWPHSGGERTKGDDEDSSGEGDNSEEDSQSGSGSEDEESEEVPVAKKTPASEESDLKFEISSPAHHYEYKMEVQFKFKPNKNTGSCVPISFEVAPEKAWKMFSIDSRKHADYSARESAYKRADITKAMPKTISFSKFHNSSPFKVGIREERVEALNTISFDSGDALSDKTKNKFLAIIEPNHTVYFQTPQVSYNGESVLQSNLAKKYGHTDPIALRKTDVRWKKGSVSGKIRDGTPYSEVLMASNLARRDESGKATYVSVDGWFIVETAIIIDLISLFELTVHGQLVYWDLSQILLKAYVLPPAENWSDFGNSIFCAVDDAQRDLLLDRCFSIDMTLVAEIAFPSLKPEKASDDDEHMAKQLNKKREELEQKNAGKLAKKSGK